MDPLPLYLAIGLVTLAAIAIIARSSLKAFDGWLALKRAELDRNRDPGMPSAVARIDIADLKERIRKLEAIAAGVDI